MYRQGEGAINIGFRKSNSFNWKTITISPQACGRMDGWLDSWVADHGWWWWWWWWWRRLMTLLFRGFWRMALSLPAIHPAVSPNRKRSIAQYLYRMSIINTFDENKFDKYTISNYNQSTLEVIPNKRNVSLSPPPYLSSVHYLSPAPWLLLECRTGYTML